MPLPKTNVEVKVLKPERCFNCNAIATVYVGLRDPDKNGEPLFAGSKAYKPIYSAYACAKHAVLAARNVMARAGFSEEKEV
jgi:hypothetical protein